MESKESYLPKEVAEYIKITWDLKNSWSNLGDSNEFSKIFKNHAIGLYNIFQEYNTKIPENIRNEIGLNTSGIEKICKEIISSK